MTTQLRSAGSRRAAFFASILILGLAPLPFGSTDGLTQSLWTLVLAGVGLFVAIRGGVGGAARVIATTFAFTGAVVLYVLFHALFLMHRAPPGSEILIPVLTNGVEAAHGALLACQPVMAAALAFSLAAIAARPPGNLARLWDACVVTGTAFAAIALLQQVFMPGWIFWEAKSAYLSSLTLPFVNRNTAAAYYGMVALISLARISLVIDRRNRLPRLRILCLVIVLIAFFATVSRAGIVIFFSAMLCFALVSRRQLFGGVPAKWVWGGALSMLLIGLPVLAGRLAARFSVEGFLDDSRACVYEATLRGIKDFLPWGAGLGWFEWVLPAYRNIGCGISGIWETAHSFYLQGLFELGWPFLVAVAAFYVIAAVFILRVNSGSSGLTIKWAAVALLFAITAHNVIDFSLQIFGFTLPLSVVLGSAAGFLARGARSVSAPSRTSMLRHQGAMEA
ncbi:hypothetical protein IZ6_26520 [Terrihabitans soli]|uniref:O-antigen ligase-related domain-containing protein n=1 Tax=Terrihabitans soli TaxID=708113 RepID=A0A6S6QVG4_9HYPH|nr:O-antigen ligase family protein [Terrihabitans soli]BCJ91917.1 hypothetical protein IZ6_26520 [Terrihabitans soli]